LHAPLKKYKISFYSNNLSHNFILGYLNHKHHAKLSIYRTYSKIASTPTFRETMVHTSDSTKQNIKALLYQGLSVRNIATRLNTSVYSVQKVRQTCLEELPLPRMGRPKKLSEQDRRACVRKITSGSAETAADLTKQLEGDHQLHVSRSTISRALRESGMCSAEKQQKPRLSTENIKSRLKFARRHQYWTVDDWMRVIWSDETKINRFCSDGRSWYWAREGTSQQTHHVKHTLKHGGGSIMVWACMTAHGQGYMCKIDGRMDQHLYKQILEDELCQTIKYYGMDIDRSIFQHDNDPKHTAKSVQEWLSGQRFSVLEWPPQSPDLNPMEHLWAHLKRQLNKYESPPKGILELWERIEEQWNKIDQATCMNLIESMPRRVEAVIKAKGKWTKY
jgi:transposase